MPETKNELQTYLDIYRAHGPSWSPDAQKLAFIANISGLDQAWLVEIESGKQSRLTDFSDRVGLVSWSPLAQHLLVTVDVGGNEHDQLYLLRASDGEVRPLTQNLDVIHHFGDWSPDGQSICYSDNSRNRKFFDTYVMDIATGNTRSVFALDATLTPLAWSPDGQYLIVSRENTGLDNDLFLVPLNGDKPRLLTAHTGEAAYETPCIAPDSLTLYVATNYEREFLAPAAIRLDASVAPDDTHAPISYLVETEWDIEDGLTLSPDGNTLAWALNRDGYSELAAYDLQARKELPLPRLPLGVVEGLTWAPDGSQLAFSFNGTRYNGNLWVAKPRDDQFLKPVTELPIRGLAATDLLEPTLIHYTAFDGLEIPGYYYQPTDRSRANANGMPVIIFVHGGPESQFRPVYSSPSMPPIQYFLNQGFAVFAPNVRGSRGYGKTFIHLDDVRLRPNSVADVKSAVEWLIVHGGADPRRIGIMGRSYGGFMVLAAITSYPDLWAAAVDIVGIANFLTFFQNTGIWRRHLRSPEYGDPERDADFLREISPLFKADRITTPLLALHGVNDPRVPVSEAEQIVAAVKARGLPSKLVLFPNEGHFMLRQSTQMLAYSSMAEWFQTYMQ
jgi:dipeptidyl aminopeptidase/acylaminoacyl peptidase